MIRSILIVSFFTSIISLPTNRKDPHEIAIKYLTKYGYMSENEKDSEINGALKKMQDFSGIQITGELDETTLTVMLTPRCSMPDQSSETIVNKYILKGNWYRNEFTYKIKNYPTYHIGLSNNSMVDKLIAQGFKDWSDVADLKFTRVSKYQNSDIELSFEPTYHGDGEPFNDDTYAHAFFPTVGLVHFNDKYRWSGMSQNPYSLYLRQITSHELGHSLGLGHSRINGSLMYPIYYINAPEYIMNEDDIKGIVSLYGAKKQTSSPGVSSSPRKVTKFKVNDDKSTLAQQTTRRSVHKSTTTSTASFMAAVEKWILILTTIVYIL